MAVTVQGLWVGSRLSTMERLSITSFLAHGHEYQLYLYEDVDNVPNGTTICDANEVLPASCIFQYRDRKSYAGFADYFRYKLLMERGGWWVDLDVICLRPFDFDSEYVFGTERDAYGREFANCGTVRIPKGAAVAQFLWQVCCEKKTDLLKWGEVGPSLVHRAVHKFSLWRYLKPSDMFYPISWFKWFDAILPGRKTAFGSEVYAVHLWNERWRLSEINKDERFAPGCLYEHLKRRYLQPDTVT